MPDADVKVPGIGPVKKKTLYIVLGGAAILAGVMWYRTRNSAATSATDASTSSTDTSNIDPATGFPAGSQEDLAALAQQDQISGGFFGGGSSGTIGTDTSTTQGFATNGQWSQAAEDYLVNNTGANPETVGNALGKYITGQPLTDSMKLVVQQAIAFEGYPPVNGPTGFPPSMKDSPAPPPPPTPKVTVPNVVRKRVNDAEAELTKAGFKSVTSFPRKDLPYIVTAQSPKAGTKAPKGSTVHLTIKEGTK